VRVRWSATALARLVEIEAHIALHDPLAAQRVVDRLLDSGDALDRFPRRGRLLPELPESGLRDLVVRGYRIVYRPSERSVEILSVFEGHRA
jgi:plasmid stabilization system protein ParE